MFSMITSGLLQESLIREPKFTTIIITAVTFSLVIAINWSPCYYATLADTAWLNRTAVIVRQALHKIEQVHSNNSVAYYSMIY